MTREGAVSAPAVRASTQGSFRIVQMLVGVLLSSLMVQMAASDEVLMRDCHSTDPRPYIYHATKTPYELINNEDSSPIFVAGNLCQQDVDALTNEGAIRIDDNQNEALTATGKDELIVLARRFRGRFAEFFNTRPEFDENDYQFRHVGNSMASMASARWFSRGIFPVHGGQQDRVRLTEAPTGDRLVHFFDNCTLWNENVGKNPEFDAESNAYRAGKRFQNTLADVTKRLGFQYNMSAEDMLLIYEACRYQKAWNLESLSPWCAAFTADNLKVLEFGEDLETYYKQGYGHELNYRQACPLVEDLVNRIRMLKTNGTSGLQERGLFYFTEDEGVLRFVARLGLFKDERPLSSEDPPSADRKWRTSLMGSFAANVAVVVYDCAGDGDLKVQLFVKEDRVHLDACRNALCTAKEFLDAYGQMADECSRRDGCDPNSASGLSAAAGTVFAAILIAFHLIFPN